MNILNIFKKTEGVVVHRKLLKFLLGVSKICHNVAIYGDTGEVPVSLKGFRLMLNYWRRLTTLPEGSLAKKALIENANIRTNWIITIEKLLRCLKLLGIPSKKFKDTSRLAVSSYFEDGWKNRLINEDISRLTTYKTLNSDFALPGHLGLPYRLRKVISRIRCSNHSLEIERGRHTNPKTPRENRLCRLCDGRDVEDEGHFLLNCPIFTELRHHHGMDFVSVPDILNMENQYQLAQYLLSAFELRQRLIWGRAGE